MRYSLTDEFLSILPRFFMGMLLFYAGLPFVEVHPSIYWFRVRVQFMLCECGVVGAVCACMRACVCLCVRACVCLCVRAVSKPSD